MVEDCGWSCHAAAKKCGIPESTAHAWLHQEEQHRTGKYRPGRPRKISYEQIDEIEKWFENNYHHRIATPEQMIKELNLNCSIRTLECLLHDIGYHRHVPVCKSYISARNRAKRVDFALQYKDKPKSFWRRGVYTDENTCQSQMHRRQKVWRKYGERNLLECVQFTFHSGRVSVSMWAAIGYNFKTHLL